LREYYESTWGPTVLADYDVRFIIEVGAVAGSSDQTEYAIETGLWPELTTPILIINYSYLLGTGGAGGFATFAGDQGGSALLLEDDIRLNNIGTIASGGGGGGGGTGGAISGGGGGGAGFTLGLGNGSARDGTYTNGGLGDVRLGGGNGGDLADSGNNGSGSNGGLTGDHAINQNGFVITYINTGTILGTITP
jgi:hypothetical protein